MIERDFYKCQFRSVMIVIRHIADIADSEMAQYLHRELTRELPELEKKFSRASSLVLDSAPTIK